MFLSIIDGSDLGAVGGLQKFRSRIGPIDRIDSSGPCTKRGGIPREEPSIGVIAPTPRIDLCRSPAAHMFWAAAIAHQPVGAEQNQD